MPPPNRLSRACGALLAAALLLPGCITAQRKIDANQAELLADAIAESERVVAQMEGAGPGRYDIRVFLSNAFLNEQLASLAGYQVVLPNDPDIDLRLVSAELSNLGALPALTLQATAKRGSISADVTITAVLVATGEPHEFRIAVKSLAPRVRVLSVNVAGVPFVQRLLTIKTIDLAAGLPRVRLPIEQTLRFGGPATTTTGRVDLTGPPISNTPSRLSFSATVPATAWTGRIVNPRWFFVRGGIYLFADVR
jgi:hypothetical protein